MQNSDNKGNKTKKINQVRKSVSLKENIISVDSKLPTTLKPFVDKARVKELVSGVPLKVQALDLNKQEFRDSFRVTS